MPALDPAAMLTDPSPGPPLRADRSIPERVAPPPADPDALRRFRAFHATLQAIAEALRAGNWTALLDEPATGPLDAQLVRAVRTRLMAEIPRPESPDGASDLDPGQVMAVIADETLLHDLVWPGQQGWAREPLQAQLYGATGDSDRILRAIDSVARGDTTAPDDVAQTIRLALDLGYLDRPAGAPPPAKPQRLFEIVFRPADPVPAPPDDFMTGALKPLAGLPVMQLPPLRPWVLALAALACAWLLVSLVLWWSQVSDVTSVAASLLASLSPAK